MIELNRTVLNIAGCCNLKCKNCLAFIPYYDTKWLMNASEAKIIIEKYFDIVDSVGTFTITGGEPLLNKDTVEILEIANHYSGQIRKSIDLVTNATIPFSDELISFFRKNNDHSRVILSDYGPTLSKKIHEIQKQFDDNNVTCRISTFTGDDMYYDGWIDFSDHSLKWKTLEERDANSRKCIHSAGKYFVINEGCIHRCSRSYWRMKNNIIPKTKGEYVDLLDDTISIEDKRTDLKTMLESVSSTSCAYCVGLCNDVPRIKPAIQLD